MGHIPITYAKAIVADMKAKIKQTEKNNMEDLKTSNVKERIIEGLIDSGGELWEYCSKDVQHLVNDHTRLIDVMFKSLSEIDEQIEKLHHRLNEEGEGISEYRQTQIDSKLDAYYNCKQIIERCYKHTQAVRV